MSRLLAKLLAKRQPRRRQRPVRRPAELIPRFETLESRRLLAITATFSAASGTLSVYGDSLDNNIVISRTAPGAIQVNGGGVAIQGGSPTVANTALIQAFGLGGNDNISLNESNGGLPSAHLYGGAGVDVLVGGSGNDRLFGQSDGDTLIGGGGADMLFGGSAGDLLLGGDGDDLAFGQSGDDQFTWNPGDDTDLNEGGAGNDAVVVNGGNGDEAFTTTANGARVRFDRLDSAPFALDIGTSERLQVNANGGNDSFSATGNLAALIQITVDGGDGNDTIFGSNGADILLGGDGNDLIDGQQGADTINLGPGDDTVQWDPGDGNDVIEGQGGTDTLRFNASNAAEIIELSANGNRLRFSRNIGNVVLDLDDVEIFNVALLGGADTVVINNLAGLDVAQINLNLANSMGGGDGSADAVMVNGTSGEDVILISGNASGVAVAGLWAAINIVGAEAASDRLTVRSLAGDDAIDASGVEATGIALTLDGGDDDDVLIGGDGADTLLGGDGDDVLIGGPGFDNLDGGLGDNVLIQ